MAERLMNRRSFIRVVGAAFLGAGATSFLESCGGSPNGSGVCAPNAPIQFPNAEVDYQTCANANEVTYNYQVRLKNNGIPSQQAYTQGTLSPRVTNTSIRPGDGTEIDLSVNGFSFNANEVQLPPTPIPTPTK